MGGRIVYNPRPAKHRCATPAREVYATGTVWQCDECMTCWELTRPAKFELVGRWDVESVSSAARRAAATTVDG